MCLVTSGSVQDVYSGIFGLVELEVRFITGVAIDQDASDRVFGTLQVAHSSGESDSNKICDVQGAPDHVLQGLEHSRCVLAGCGQELVPTAVGR